MLNHLLQPVDVVLEVLVPLELVLHYLDVLLELDLPGISLLEVSPESVQSLSEDCSLLFEVFHLGLHLEYLLLLLQL